MCVEHSTAAPDQSGRRLTLFAEEATDPHQLEAQAATIESSIPNDADTRQLRVNELPWPLLRGFQRSSRASGPVYLARGHPDGSLSLQGDAHQTYLDVELYERLSKWSHSSFLLPLKCSPLCGLASRLCKYLIIKMVNLANLAALSRNRSDRRHEPAPQSAGANQTASGEHRNLNIAAINQQQRLRRVNLISAIKWTQLINLMLLASQLVILLKLFADQHSALIEYCPRLCGTTSGSASTSRFHVSSARQQHGRARQINVRPSLASLMMTSERRHYGTMAAYLVDTSCDWHSGGSAADAREEACEQSSVQQSGERVSESITSTKLAAVPAGGHNSGTKHDRGQTNTRARLEHRPTTGRDVYHYLLIVALMDFLSNLNWCHHCRQHQTLGQETKSSARHSFWLINSIRLLTGAGHSFQLAQAVSLYIVLKSSEPAACLALLACFLNYLNQIATLAVRLRYLHSRLNSSSSSAMEWPQLDASEHNLHDRSANHLAGGPLISVRDTSGDLAASSWSDRDGRVTGSWLPMPQQQERRQLWPMVPDSKISKYLLMSQMVQLKLSLITLFIHLDARSQSSPTLILAGDTSSQEVVILICCIIESLRCMYAQYDLYYTKYTRQSSASDRSSKDVI